MTGLDTFHRALLGKAYRHAQPGNEERLWGWRDMEDSD